MVVAEFRKLSMRHLLIITSCHEAPLLPCLQLTTLQVASTSLAVPRLTLDFTSCEPATFTRQDC